MRSESLIGFVCSLSVHTALCGVVAGVVGFSPARLMGSGIETLSISIEGDISAIGRGALAPESTRSDLQQSMRIPPPPHQTLVKIAAEKKRSSAPIITKARATMRSSKVAPDSAMLAAQGSDQQCFDCAGERGAAGGTSRVSGVSPIEVPKPPYPWAARRMGFEGKVQFDILVGTDGRVKDAALASSSGRSDCDQAARDTILSKWHFEPATRFGAPVEWKERVAVVFQLHE